MSGSQVSVARYAPNLRVTIAGQALRRDASAMITGVEVTRAWNSASTFSIQLQDVHLGGKYWWLDGMRRSGGDRGGSAPIDIGHAVSIAMGYADRLEPILEGRIQGLSASFGEGLGPSLTVTGSDPAFDGMTERREAKTFRENKTDSAIVEEIAQAVGLRAEVTPTSLVHPTLTMNAGSYFDFVESLAAANGYVFGYAGDSLVFRPRSAAQGRPATLTWGRDLLSASAEVDTRQVPEEVTVSFRHPTEGRDLRVTVRAGEEEEPPDSRRRRGSEIPADRGARRGLVVANRPVRSEAEARQVARSLLQQLSDRVLKLSGEVVGGLDLKPTDQVTVEGLGPWFSTTYVVRRTTHSIGTGGYRLRFEAETSGVPQPGQALAG